MIRGQEGWVLELNGVRTVHLLYCGGCATITELLGRSICCEYTLDTF